MTWRVADRRGEVLTAPAQVAGTIGMVASRTIYAGVVGYTSGTVVWTLNNSGWVSGSVPVLAAAPAGKTGVTFFATSYGTALLTATLNGNAATPTLRAVASSGGGDSVTWSEV